MARILWYSLCVVALAFSACVDHRPLRNGLSDEAVYLEKSALIAPNPKIEGSTDDGWLFKATVVAASSPNPLGDYAFPGLESELQYVKFRFREDKLQLLDGRKLQRDNPENPNDDLATSTERVMLEFDGKHVDVLLRENLDGEKTNFVEENTEKGWQDRKYFKVDFEKVSLDPISSMAWFYADFVAECATLKSVHLVPNSFEWDKEDQSINWVLEANYALNVWGGCYNVETLATGAGTATIRYRLSFYRPGPSDYVPEVIGEKDEVNKKYGAFQVMNLFKDSETGLLSAKSLLQRWDPHRKEPVVFYFHKGFPERFKPMFVKIEESTNEILEKAGASLRFHFKEWNDGGIERQLGDIRYSFVTWHQDIDTTMGLLGYGPSSSDPRTGEVISANLHLYNVGMDYYRFLIQDYLEENGGLKKPDPQKNWENISCKDGETVAPATAEGRLRTTLFDAMRKVMDLDQDYDEGADARALFLPTPARGWDAFLKDYHRLLPELRYVEPGYNPYVYRTTGGLDLSDYKTRLKAEREFRAELERVIFNENPFEGLALHTRDGIEAQLDFHRRFRNWRDDVQKLQWQREMLLGLRNIYTVDDADALNAVSRAARKCVDGKWESDEAYSERIITEVVAHVAIHEFGHNLGLRHNFYGSVDTQHMAEGELSASVMDYVRSQHEAGSGTSWGPYDKAALTWIYGTQEKRAEVMKEDFLYCTDEHRLRSPLCYAHDVGVTPAQIVLNMIEDYDLTYKFRNKRAYRKFWDTTTYAAGVYSRLFTLLRFYYLGVFDWAGGNVQDTLKRLDQISGRKVLSNDEYDEIAQDFGQEAEAAIMMLTAFFDAIVNQSAAFRNYATEFDPFYGDPLRMGIIFDKLAATVAFMDLHDVADYNPNIQTYVSIYDSPYGSKHAALTKRVLDNLLGANYDTFEWFRYYALLIFAQVSNDSIFRSPELKDRIAIRRFESLERFEEEFGPDAYAIATAPGNHAQLFEHNGEQYVYAYVPDRGFHLVANRSRNPVSFKFIRDFNEDMNELAEDTNDNYGLKIMLAYYEYFNNFSGY